MPKFGQYSYQPVSNTGASPPSGMEMERMAAQTQQTRMNTREKFEQQKRDKSVRANMAGAMSGDPNALASVYASNPEMGMQVERQRANQQRLQQQQMFTRNTQMNEYFGDTDEIIDNALDNNASEHEIDQIAESRLMGGQQIFGPEYAEMTAQRMGQFEGPQQGGLPPQGALTRERFAELTATPPEPIKVSERGRLIDPETYQDLLKPAEAGDDPAKKKTQFDQSQKLRKELSGLSKSFQAQDDAYGRVIASAADPSPAGDLALIFNYMKVLDPGSTVREGEFATAQNSGSVPSRIQARYNSIISGERLTAKMRKDFVKRSKTLYTDATKKQLKRQERFTGIAERAEIKVEDVVTNLVNLRQEEFDAVMSVENNEVYPLAPPIGTIKKGHRYVGGNPNLKENWEKI